MELTCTENFSNAARASRDKVIFNDIRVINNLLNDEMFSIPKCDYFQTIQNDLQPFMRKVVTTWMLEVCEEQMCEDQVLPLAINIMDRFLCICPIKKQQLQLLGATCLLIATKVRSTNMLPIDLLSAYTDYSVTYEHISSWELLVLSKLQWNILAVTGFDYIDQVLERCSWGHESQFLRRHANTLVSMCYTEPSLIQTPPSVIAAACISSAIRGLKLSSSEVALRDTCNMLNVNPRTVEFLVGVIDNAVSKVAPSLTPTTPESKTTVQGYESPHYGQPETPTEVENIYF
ncbi:G1/S-specific cyclin-D2-like [Diorhabda sublineata]|uniref:G1/S-specific cyclin-D2-like n=1 Tax=Diorhabda sublineata TaxID=1163346 RepID=UPI0024E0F351|nr:G1/S-specific cyclin-D2-like [Diorhabda sublineata]